MCLKLIYLRKNWKRLTTPTDSKLNNMAEENYKRWLIYIMLSLAIFFNSMLVSGNLFNWIYPNKYHLTLQIILIVSFVLFLKLTKCRLSQLWSEDSDTPQAPLETSAQHSTVAPCWPCCRFLTLPERKVQPSWGTSPSDFSSSAVDLSSLVCPTSSAVPRRPRVSPRSATCAGTGSAWRVMTTSQKMMTLPTTCFLFLDICFMVWVLLSSFPSESASFLRIFLIIPTLSQCTLRTVVLDMLLVSNSCS